MSTVLLQTILKDAERTLKVATADEQKAQQEYEALVTISNEQLAAYSEEKTNATAAKAQAEEKKASADQDLNAANDEKANLEAQAKDLSDECDFLLKNFDTRKEARQTEIEEIQSAKAILQGAKMD